LQESTRQILKGSDIFGLTIPSLQMDEHIFVTLWGHPELIDEPR
jgi:hypothetical protein